MKSYILQNKKKNHKETVKIEAKKYLKELDLEIALKGLHEEDLSESEYLEEVAVGARYAAIDGGSVNFKLAGRR